MGTAMAVIGVLLLAGAIIAMGVGAILGFVRGRWRPLKYSAIVFGVSLFLLIVAGIVTGPNGGSGSASKSPDVDDVEPTQVPTSTRIPTSVPTATPIPTATPEPTFDDLKRAAKQVPWEELYRDNEKHEGKLVYLEGEIVQVITEGNSNRYRLRVAVTHTDRGYDSAEVVFVHYTGPERLLEDDLVEIVGIVKGLYTYRSVLGGPITIPEVTEAWVERQDTVTSIQTLTLSPTPTSTQQSLTLLPTPTKAPTRVRTTSTPTAVPALPTATPLPPTATPVLVGQSRNNPIPFGQPTTLINTDGFALWVVDVLENATQLIMAENRYNDPPPDGHQFLMIRIKVKNTSEESKSFTAAWRLHLVGASNLAISGGCGVIPDYFESHREIFEGGELEGNICFTVRSSDIGTHVMYDDAPVRDSRIYYALQ